MSVQAVLFDIGGVLVHAPRTGWVEAWAARLATEPKDLTGRLEPVWRSGDVGALSLAEVEARTAAALGLDEAALRAFMDDLWADYLGVLNTDLATYFAGLRPRYRTGIISNSFVGARERERARYDFEAMCDVIVYSHEEGITKPDPRVYTRACDRLGVPAEAAVFLDDLEACVAGARAVGMHAVRFVNTDQAIAELNAHLHGRAPR